MDSEKLAEILHNAIIEIRESLPKIPCVNGKVTGIGFVPACTYLCAVENGCMITIGNGKKEAIK